MAYGHTWCKKSSRRRSSAPWEALWIQRKRLGDAHPEVGRTHKGMGNTLRKMGMHEEALEHLSKALMIQLKALGVFWKESLEVADVRYHTGLVSGSRGRLRVRGGCLGRM